MKVFIVEDSPAICERLQDMIRGIEHIELLGNVDNEADAVRDICAAAPDLVILDLALASGGGMEVLRQIKLLGYPGTVVVLTNYAYPQYQKKCMDLGANHFLDKSMDIEKLGGLLERLAGEQHLVATRATL